MNNESKQLIEDCFLRPIANPKSTNNNSYEPTPSKVPLKAELQVLRLSDDAQNEIMETLRYIHGQHFQLDDKSKYVDRGSKSVKGYWQERGNLVIQGGYDYSNIQKSGCDVIDRNRMLSITKLESYGFQKTHCLEALECCKGDPDDSLELLFEKYFPPPLQDNWSSDLNVTDTEIKDMRSDEMAALQSIFDTAFEEKEINKVWLLKLKIDHLLIHSPSEQKKKQATELEEQKQKKSVKPLELCRNFAKGKCNYGIKCLFSHKIETKNSSIKPIDPNLDSNWFYLEVRFPSNNKYPFEAPIIILKTTCPDIPHMLCLRITRRILKEARELAINGMPCVYTISDLLQADDIILDFLRNDRHQFLDAKKSLFEVNVQQDKTVSIKKDLPSHYERAKQSNKVDKLSIEQTYKEDLNLVRKFLDKQSNKAYKDMLTQRKKLPAWSMMTNILELIDKSQIVVISGETGCGKSTQVPQFLLDDWLLNCSTDQNGMRNKHVEIVCTQPRRISAISVAERVAQERTEKIGNTVGYSIRLENKISSSTRLTFCTTGILLRRLQSDPSLECVSHVIVDEVHERSEESDFLLLILKELMMKRTNFRVILMSATLNSNLFSSYFQNAPVIEIPGRTFPVEQLFLEDILDRSKFILEADSQYCRHLKKNEEQQLLNELEYADVFASNVGPPKSIKDENLSIADIFARYCDYSRPTCKTLFLTNPIKINPELIETILKYIVEGDHTWPKEGTILIFLPGISEIQMVHDALCDNVLFSPRTGNFVIVPLHSTLSSEEQSLVFRKFPTGKRKIVLSTNIAETSVTIDDCVFVIDCGQMKEKRFDSNRNMESLDLVWVSRANAMQRKGRAGRVMPGVAIHLFTRNRYENHFISQPVPEIHRIPLEQLLMRIKILPNFKNMDAYDVISKTLEPPILENITLAIKRLQDVGAFDDDQNLTALGCHLAALPVDVRIGKLMLFGAIFQCVDSVLTIAACLSYKSPFVSPFNKRTEADNKKKEFAICNSDHLTVLKAYKRWILATRRSKYTGNVYAEENYLSWKTLETIIEVKQQLFELLCSIGFVPGNLSLKKRRLKDDILDMSGLELNVNGDNNQLLSALLCAALYPNVIKVLTPEKSFTMSAGGAIPRQPLPSELRFKTNQDGYVSIHPSSVNSVVGHFASPFLVFQEKVKTSKVFVRECTMVQLLPLVLFSGSDIKIERNNDDFVVLLEGGWIIMQASTYQVAEMLKTIRLELVKMLEEKIRDPCLNLLHHANGCKIISTIVNIVSKE